MYVNFTSALPVFDCDSTRCKVGKCCLTTDFLHMFTLLNDKAALPEHHKLNLSHKPHCGSNLDGLTGPWFTYKQKRNLERIGDLLTEAYSHVWVFHIFLVF